MGKQVGIDKNAAKGAPYKEGRMMGFSCPGVKNGCVVRSESRSMQVWPVVERL
jgi:hypothetical protein